MIHFPALHFQFEFLITNATSEEVNKVLSDLREKIGTKLWEKIFPIILCDNRTEFNEFYRLEVDEKGDKLSNVFIVILIVLLKKVLVNEITN